MDLFSMKGPEVRLCAISVLQYRSDAPASAKPDPSWRSKRLPTTPRPEDVTPRLRRTSISRDPTSIERKADLPLEHDRNATRSKN
jgi:hypothetical protein